MNKLNLRRISEILSEKELKNVVGGSFIGTGSGSPCYSSDGSCYGVCAFIDPWGKAHHGTCTDMGDNICACKAEN